MLIDILAASAIKFLLSLSILAPDFILSRKFVFTNKRSAFRYFLSSLILTIPVFFSGMNFSTVAILTLSFLIISAWHVNYRYFGEVLGPDSLALLVKPDHFRDVVSVGFDEVRTFVPTLSVVALCLVVSIYLVSWSPDHDFQWWSSVLAWLVLIGAGLRMALRRRARHDYPKLHMPGLFGGLHALALAVKWGFTLPKTLQGAVKYSMQPARDALVIVLMGESINPARMGLFSGLDTTPRIDAIMAGAGPSRGAAKTGFSAAVASNSSVVGFLSGSPFPWHTEGSRSLFNLARSQGFATRYWSGQAGSPVDVLGDKEAIDDIHCLENAPESFGARKDWHLLDRLNERPFGDREFALLYPRCNHAPFHCHDPNASRHAPNRKISDIFEHYDAGMRVFDAFASDLIEHLQKDGRRFFLFITSDHNEMLSDRDGLRGHSLSGQAIGAFVPHLLLTNDPESDVFRDFSTQTTPTAWSVVELVLRIMGVKATVEPALDTKYVGNSLPFCKAGHMRVWGDDSPFRVDNYDRAGTLQGSKEFSKEHWLGMYRRPVQPQPAAEQLKAEAL
ncbi:hypothetical protein [Mesorhizobium marinum]|uniref:Sulfatase N-terminal domain-containing protein n=1 Tax=Mesorhizobium marinum TaxID=3228790 RepID=A0ABV3R580_9HYPH